MKTQKIELVCPKCGLSHVEHMEHEPLDDERAFLCLDCGKQFVITVSFDANGAVINYRDLPAVKPMDVASACRR